MLSTRLGAHPLAMVESPSVLVEPLPFAVEPPVGPPEPPLAVSACPIPALLVELRLKERFTNPSSFQPSRFEARLAYLALCVARTGTFRLRRN